MLNQPQDVPEHCGIRRVGYTGRNGVIDDIRQQEIGIKIASHDLHQILLRACRKISIDGLMKLERIAHRQTVARASHRAQRSKTRVQPLSVRFFDPSQPAHHSINHCGTILWLSQHGENPILAPLNRKMARGRLAELAEELSNSIPRPLHRPYRADRVDSAAVGGQFLGRICSRVEKQIHERVLSAQLIGSHGVKSQLERAREGEEHANVSGLRSYLLQNSKDRLQLRCPAVHFGSLDLLVKKPGERPKYRGISSARQVSQPRDPLLLRWLQALPQNGPHLLVLHTLGEHQPPLVQEIVLLQESVAVPWPSVSRRSTRLLHVVLQTLGHVQVDDCPDILLVQPHTEGNGGDNHPDLPRHKGGLRGVPLLRQHISVVCRHANPRLLQVPGGLLRHPLHPHVHDDRIHLAVRRPLEQAEERGGGVVFEGRREVEVAALHLGGLAQSVGRLHSITPHNSRQGQGVAD
mmetsp:Transcript_55784/g.122186  ORF Transcript_55784/g.122186 Transcript_55784/m.122186 type:complete len:464 (+) Transcript_55784:472-1863(+)